VVWAANPFSDVKTSPQGTAAPPPILLSGGWFNTSEFKLRQQLGTEEDPAGDLDLKGG